MNTSISQFPGHIDAALNVPWKVRAMAIVDAIVINVVMLAVARLVTGDWPVASVGDDDQTIGFAWVIGVTLVAGLVAWGLLAMLERVTGNAKTLWTAIAVAIFLVSLFGPLGSGVGMDSKVVLAMMHVGAAATIIPLMRRSAA